jgi:hypothetical protein
VSRSNFSTVNVRLVGSGGIDQVVDKAASKLKGFQGKYSNSVELAKDIFDFGADGGAFRALSSVTGSLAGMAGPIGLAATALSSVITGAKSAYDMYADYSKNKTDTQAAKLAEEREAKMAPARAKALADSEALKSMQQVTEQLSQQVRMLKAGGENAQLYAAKLKLVERGLLTADQAFNPRFALQEAQRQGDAVGDRRGFFNPVDPLRMNRVGLLQLNPLFQQLRAAEAGAEWLRLNQMADQFRVGNGPSSQTMQRDMANAGLLARNNLIGRGDLARFAARTLEQAESFAPPPDSRLATAVRAGSQEAASFMLRSQADAYKFRDPTERLKDALERMAATEDAQLKAFEKLADQLANQAPLVATF